MTLDDIAALEALLRDPATRSHGPEQPEQAQVMRTIARRLSRAALGAALGAFAADPRTAGLCPADLAQEMEVGRG